MFIVVEKKTLLIIVAAILVVAIAASVTIVSINALAASSKDTPVVVLDAGHGGVDNGGTGINSGITEKELNLILVLKVKKLLEKDGIKVVLTRENNDGLYGDSKKNMKRADMEKRKEIILKANASVVVSLHGNRFPDKSRRGAQVFFEEFSAESKALAALLQSSLNTLNNQHVQREFQALKGDYYLLKCSKVPSAIVEYGFLSNPDDDALLQKEEYRDDLAFRLYSGIKAYLTKNAISPEPEVTGDAL